MCKVTDLEYRLLSQLAYYNELTEELNSFQQGKNFSSFELKIFKKTLTKLEEDLKKNNSELINNPNLKSIFSRWKVLYSLQGFLNNDHGKELLANINEENKHLDAFVFIKQCFYVDGSDKQYMVIAFRGTRPTWSKQLRADITENINTTNFEYFAEKKYQSDWAVIFYKYLSEKYEDNHEISLTGHSKGGALVQKVILYTLQAMQKKVSGVTFSASGILKIIDKEEEGVISDEEIKIHLEICKNFTIDKDNIIHLVKKIDRDKNTLYVGHHVELEHTADGNPHRIAASFDKHFGEDEMLKKV